MPYTPENVPDHVPSDKAKQWSAIWNSTYEKEIEKGTDKEKAEQLAFRNANAILESNTMEFLMPINLDDSKSAVLLYVGKFNHPMYGEFDITAKHLQQAVQNFNNGVATIKDSEGKKVLPMNYNHSHYEPGPDNAVNSGFISAMSFTNNNLVINYDLTDKAKEFVQKREYQWLSAEFTDKYTDENNKQHGFAVTGAALVNRPFLKNQIAIAASDGELYYIQPLEYEQIGDSTMELQDEQVEELMEMLNLDDHDKIIETIKKLTTDNAEREKFEQDIRKLLELKDDGDVTKAITELISKASETKEPEKGKVLVDEQKWNDVQRQAQDGAEAAKKLSEMRIDTLIDKALEDEKIAPAQEEAVRKIAETSFELAEEFVDKAVEKKFIRSPEGSTGAGQKSISDQDAEQISETVMERARELQEKDKDLNLSDAVNKVLEADPVLAEKYNNIQ